MSTKTLNDVSDEENNNLEDTASLPFDDELDVAPSTAVCPDDVNDANGTDHNVADNDDNASIFTGTIHIDLSLWVIIVHDLESVLHKQNYIPNQSLYPVQVVGFKHNRNIKDKTREKRKKVSLQVQQQQIWIPTADKSVKNAGSHGMISVRGLILLAYQSTDAISHELFGNPVFSATMFRNRFKFLISHMSFDNLSTRSTRWQLHRFAAFGEIFEEFYAN